MRTTDKKGHKCIYLHASNPYNELSNEIIYSHRLYTQAADVMLSTYNIYPTHTNVTIIINYIPLVVVGVRHLDS